MRPQVYGGRVTLHGLSMLFFFLMGVWYGYAGNVYVPLELGRMDLVFSRSNVISLWMFMAAFWLLIAGGHSGCTDKNYYGWTMYPPLSSVHYTGPYVQSSR